MAYAYDTVQFVVPQLPGNDGGLFAFVSYIPPVAFDGAVELVALAPNNVGHVIANSMSGLSVRLQWTNPQTMSLSVSESTTGTSAVQQPVARVTFFKAPVGTPLPGAALRYALLCALRTGRAHVALSMRVVQQEQMVYTTRSNGPAGEVVEQQVHATRAMANWVITPLGAIDDGNAE
ncbi:hypothetical protein EXIGLDRAFT_817168 [Exidia glandulosa HHB12029]|uniref:Uncharacterized protein n=1 Tax=Exidia glandulosa HHB12029 TaxID=1314781 RepID=A0A165BAT2_EXIGL|nr:hypothetical protein EXIGLDRAFT_817168 [Exidia glandulosa HHB12029]